MPRNRLSPTNLTTIIVAIVGTIATIATAYFAFRGNIAPVELPLNATLTAEAKITISPIPVLSIATLTPDTLVPIATETLQPTLPPTLTQIIESPTPTPVILFSDDFDSNANGWALGIRDGNLTSQNREIINGALQLDIDFYENAYGWVNAPDFRAENFYISVDAEVVQYTNRSKIGVVIAFRISNQGNTAYAIEFNNDGTLALYSSKTIKQYGQWQLLHQENSDAFQVKEGTVNNFGIRVLGQRFTAYANDMVIYTFEDNDFRGVGEVGIGINGESQSTAIVKFDNLILTK